MNDDGKARERGRRSGPKARAKGKAGLSRRAIVLGLILVTVLILVPVLASVRMPDVEAIGMAAEANGVGQPVRTFFTVQVHNPNVIGATVDSIEGKAYVNGRYAGDFQRTEQVDVPAGGTVTFDIEFFLNNIVMVKWNADNDIRAKGTVVIDGVFRDWSVDFDETEKVRLP